jgi:ubiquinone/menaquinone biosynthesis C-methylase UbiE
MIVMINPLKAWIRKKIQWIASEGQPGIGALKYLPYDWDTENYSIPKRPSKCETCPSGLPIPPRDLWYGYGSNKEEYLASGQAPVSKMLDALKKSEFSLGDGYRVLDFGCSAGRLIRHLVQFSDKSEIWGVDVSARHIDWAKQYLSPPFHFATTTTIPHLPFEDRSFDLIYCGSIFTHIDYLAEAWLCELRRILSPRGRLYITIHDEHTMAILDERPWRDVAWVKHVRSQEIYQRSRNDLGMLVIGRDIHCNVFYSTEYFQKVLSSVGFRVLSITEEAYLHQTAVLVERT